MPEMTNKESSDRDIFSAKLKSATLACWHPELGLAEVTRMRGNFWRTVGFTINQRSFLYPEEALFLVERNTIIMMEDSKPLSNKVFSETIMKKIPLCCYLVYSKLKKYDYIVVRHKNSIRSFSSETDIYKAINTHSSSLSSSSSPSSSPSSLLDVLVSFDLYIHGTSWSKSKMKHMIPKAYVIISTDRLTFSPSLTTCIIDAAAGVPVIFAVMHSSHHIQLEEYTDAAHSLDWSLDMSSSLSIPSLTVSSFEDKECNNEII